MGARLSKLRQGETDHGLKIVLFGPPSAGKTTIFQKLVADGEHVPVNPTGVTVASLEYPVGDRDDGILNIWDFPGGQMTPESLDYFKGASACVLVVDAADQTMIRDAQRHLGLLLKHPAYLPRVLLVLANKQDLSGAKGADIVADALDLQPLWNLHWDVQACSALEGDGLSDALEWVVDAIETHTRDPDRVYNVPYNSWTASLHAQGRFPAPFCRQVVVAMAVLTSAQLVLPINLRMALIQCMAAYGPNGHVAAVPVRELVSTPTSRSIGCSQQLKAAVCLIS